MIISVHLLQSSEAHPTVMLFALIALEKFSQTSEFISKTTSRFESCDFLTKQNAKMRQKVLLSKECHGNRHVSTSAFYIFLVDSLSTFTFHTKQCCEVEMHMCCSSAVVPLFKHICSFLAGTNAKSKQFYTLWSPHQGNSYWMQSVDAFSHEQLGLDAENSIIGHFKLHDLHVMIASSSAQLKKNEMKQIHTLFLPTICARTQSLRIRAFALCCTLWKRDATFILTFLTETARLYNRNAAKVIESLRKAGHGLCVDIRCHRI